MAYASRVFSKEQITGYGPSKKEACAVRWALKKWSNYLMGHRFTLRVDCTCLKYVLKNSSDDPLLRGIGVDLQGFDFDVVCRRTHLHVPADALSRIFECDCPEEEFFRHKKERQLAKRITRKGKAETEEAPQIDGDSEESSEGKELPLDSVEELLDKSSGNAELLAENNEAEDNHKCEREVVVSAITETGLTPLSNERVRTAQRDDPVLKIILDELPTDFEGPLPIEMKPPGVFAKEQGKPYLSLYSNWKNLSVKDGVLLLDGIDGETKLSKTRIVIPRSLREDVLYANHDHILAGGHNSYETTMKKLRQRYYWYGMRVDVELWIRGCATCAETSKGTQKWPQAPLNPVLRGYRNQCIAIDMIGPLTKSKGFQYILTIVDEFTRLIVAVPMGDISAKAVARQLLLRYILVYGVPDSLKTDWGTNFKSELMDQVCEQLRIQREFSIPYQPSTNGKVERANRKLKIGLSKYCHKDPSKWSDVLPYLVFALNATPNAATGFSPYFLTFMEDAQVPGQVFYVDEKQQQLGEYVQTMLDTFQRAGEVARQMQKAAVRRQKDYFLKKRVSGSQLEVGQLVYLFRPNLAKSRKFRTIYAGPYRIIEKLSDTVFLVQKGKKQLKVHYNQLKPYVVKPVRERLEAKASGDEQGEEEEGSDEDEEMDELLVATRELQGQVGPGLLRAEEPVLIEKSDIDGSPLTSPLSVTMPRSPQTVLFADESDVTLPPPTAGVSNELPVVRPDEFTEIGFADHESSEPIPMVNSPIQPSPVTNPVANLDASQQPATTEGLDSGDSRNSKPPDRPSPLKKFGKVRFNDDFPARRSQRERLAVKRLEVLPVLKKYSNH